MKISRSLFKFLLTGVSIFISVLVYGQSPVKNYEKEWKRVGNFIKKNLPQSAVEEVKKIYSLAKKENQDAQVIKALVFMTGLQSENRENNEILSIKEFEAQLISAKESAASIMRSLLAELYWDYYQQHRWELYRRTETTNFKKEDIATWSTEDFHRQISALFLQSIRAGKLLQQTKLESYDAIIIKGNARSLRPTLYDLLIFRALDYFENDERDIKKPAYAFELDQASVFDPASEFIKHRFSTPDTGSLHYKALLLYQEVIAFHLNDNRPEALIDADLQRITFVKTNSVHPDKDQLYFNAISQVANKYELHPAAAQAWYLLAAWYNEKADTYKPFGDTTHRYDRVKAREICEKVLQQKTNSEGKTNCSNLLNQINKRSFEFTIEKVNVPRLPFRIFVEYRNIKQLYLRLVRADQRLKDQLQNLSDEKYWPLLTAASPLKSWQQNLPATFDYQEHGTEIRADGLPNGEYILLASDQGDFNTGKSILGARLFYVSNISYVNTGNEFFVLHRENGSPLQKAQVQIWEQRYDYKQSKYVKSKEKLYSTDKNGFFRLEKRSTTETDRYNYNYSLEINYNDDRLFIDDMSEYYYTNNPQEIKPNTNIFFFTDRSLYRPGQIVFFKGIAISRTIPGRTGAIVAGHETMVYLRDANYQTIDSIKVKTGEFGSFSGRFNLPASGLNGAFSIYAKDDDDVSTVEFHVEEYKRPKFYVDFEPIKGTYKVNDKISVNGFAKAYAGNAIDEAMIKYRVVRKPRYIYPWLSWRWWQPPVQEMEIAHGEMKTGKDGKFKIEFTAIPDRKIDKKLEPVFDYAIYADVTDINGETRSGEKTVSVSYKSLMIVSTIPGTIPVDSLNKIYIRTQNMNGEFEPAVVTVRAFRLKEEKRLIRDRYWGRPDQFVMTKAEYLQNFPHDEYDNESDYKSWEKGAMAFEKKDSARASGDWFFSKNSLSPGIYMIEITTKDKAGEEVKDVKYVEIYDEKSQSLLQPSYLWAGFKKNFAEPGETARILWGTSADSLFVIQQVNRKQNVQEADHEFSFLNMSEEKRNFTFTITEKDRGAFPVNWMFIKHNRLYQLNEAITVPWTNKELTIDYASFREKTLPGSTEKWKLRITGLKKDKVAAELLAGMYDASLDQFHPHNWDKPWLWYAAYVNINWNGNNNFARITSRNKNISEGTYTSFEKVYDNLLASYIFSPTYRNSINPLFWENPLDYAYSEFRNPRLMRLPKPVLSRALDGKAAGLELQEVTVAANRDERKKDGDKDGVDQKFDSGEPKAQQDPAVQIRKNFNETAFFFPELRTDSTGAIEFSFTIPEALTKWKFMALAHTKDAAFGLSTKEIVTQKDLMVQPNAPRFMREGDKMEFSSKIVNMTDKEITGSAEFQLFDAATNEPMDGRFRNMVPNQYFTVGAGQSEVVKFPIDIPYQFNRALVWRIVAKAGNFSDGEENTLPVLTNRMMVTETLPLNMRTEGSKNFSFQKLLQSGNSESLVHYGLTLEYTSNPAWYAVQALPYLMEYPYECAEQTWNRYYANSLATYISNANPKIKAVFEKWKIKDTAALMSNLQKNQELKSVLLEETPWVLQAKTEAEQKKNIALLFDMVRMSSELNSNYEKLKQMQSSNGGFVWFKGGPDDRYMTQYIVTGIGHLMHLKGVAGGQTEKLKSILKSAIPYLDKKIKDDYDQLIKNKTDLKKYSPDYMEIQYLYMRSFFPDYPVAQASLTAYNFFKGRLPQAWTGQSKYMQAMIALILYRSNDAKTSNGILASLKETAVVNEEMGMYYQNLLHGWFWYEAPIETQALLIEAFQEAGKDLKTVDDLKTWLLKNKQTNDWRTTKATAEACYALLLQGSNWISNEPVVTIKLGNTTISSTDNKQEAGTGYFKTMIDGNKVKPEMGNVTVTVSPLQGAGGPTTTWGALYWQYFEDLDKITTASTPLKLVKKLFIEKNTDRGPVLIPVNDGDVLHVGDKIKVRIELRADRDMEYVHMKDMRAAAMEPVNVLSGYKWQGGLGYYESTRDASTNFFFNYLPKGVYVFEYPLFVTHTGNFSNGITSIQCMYAPEFSSHSEGIRITVE